MKTFTKHCLIVLFPDALEYLHQFILLGSPRTGFDVKTERSAAVQD